MKYRVLVSAPYIQPVLDRFKHLFEENDIETIVPSSKERLDKKELLQYIEIIDGAICGDDPFSKDVLRHAKCLKVISKWGTGIDSIDKDAAEQMGVHVYNTPDAFSKAVADSVLGYILIFARRLLDADKEMREKGWHKIPGISLEECTLGVIGVGNVGKQVVKRGAAFGMRVMGNDIAEIHSNFIEETELEAVSKEEICKKADFISINCDLNHTSYKLIKDEQFNLMKPNSYIINTARGPIIDERALIRALQNKCIAGAALDVFETEPLPKDSPLFGFNNVLLSPHNANSSPRAWEYVHKNTVKNLFKGLNLNTNQFINL